MKHFLDIPVPQLVKDNCEITDKGMYAPAIILKEGDVHHFKINDDRKVMICVIEKRCSICGTELKDDTWFIGGPASVFHKRGAIADLPVHKACGEYALQVCPYMAYARYHSKINLDKLYEKLKDKSIKLENPTIDFDRVPMFCFAKASSYTVHHTHTIVFKPRMPYEAVEFWNDGVQLSKEEGEKILSEHFATKYTLEDLAYQLL